MGVRTSSSYANMQLGFLLLIVYGAIVMSRGNIVDSQSVMALWSIVSVVLAIGSSYGLASAFGVKYNDVTNSLIFVAAGIGMDDAFVIMRNYARVDPTRELPIPTRIERAMASGGASICVTSLTDFVVFMTGVLSSLPVIQAFSIYAGLAILFDLIFQSTFFVAMLAYDAKRQASERADCLCCVRPRHPKNRHCWTACISSEYKPTDGGIVDILVGDYLPRLLRPRAAKAVVLLGTCVLASLSFYGASQLRSDFSYEWFIRSDSAVKEVFAVRDEWFGDGRSYDFGIYTRDGQYHVEWQSLLKLGDALRAEPWVSAASVDNWFEAYEAWLRAGAAGSRPEDGCTVDAILVPPEVAKRAGGGHFYSCLRIFLETTNEGMAYIADVRWTKRGAIKGTKISAQFENMANDDEQVAGMDDVRRVAESVGADFDAIAYAFNFIYLEGSKVIRWQTVRSLIISGVFVTVVTLVLLMNIAASLIVLLHVALVDAALLAILWVAGFSFNMITSIVIVLAVGLSVDYSTHIVYAFLEAQSKDRHERVQIALRHIGSTVLHGGITTWLSVAVLATANSYVFKVFFISFSTIVAFALLYGLLLVPVLLVLVGPAPLGGKTMLHKDDIELTSTKVPVAEPSFGSVDTNTPIDPITPMTPPMSPTTPMKEIPPEEATPTAI